MLFGDPAALFNPLPQLKPLARALGTPNRPRPAGPAPAVKQQRAARLPRSFPLLCAGTRGDDPATSRTPATNHLPDSDRQCVPRPRTASALHFSAGVAEILRASSSPH